MAMESLTEPILPLTPLSTLFHAALTVIENDPLRSPADLLEGLGLLEPLRAERTHRMALRTHEEVLARTAVLRHLPSPRDPEVRSITAMKAPSGREKARAVASGARTMGHKRSSGPHRSRPRI